MTKGFIGSSFLITFEQLLIGIQPNEDGFIKEEIEAVLAVCFDEEDDIC